MYKDIVAGNPDFPTVLDSQGVENMDSGADPDDWAGRTGQSQGDRGF